MSVHFSFQPDDGSNKSADVKRISWFSLFGGRLLFIGFVVVLFVVFFVVNFKRPVALGASFTATPFPTFTVVFSTATPLSTATPVPTSTATPVPTSTATPVPTSTATPVPTSTATPFFIVNLLPPDFSPGWCVQVRADAVWTMAGDRFASGEDGYVYFSSEVLSQRVIIERALWFHDYYFNDCGRYE